MENFGILISGSEEPDDMMGTRWAPSPVKLVEKNGKGAMDCPKPSYKWSLHPGRLTAGTYKSPILKGKLSSKPS